MCILKESRELANGFIANVRHVAKHMKFPNIMETMGTRLYIFNIDGDVFEPISQKKNVFIDAPVFSNERHSFGIILYDFNQSVIQAFEYFPKQEKLSLLVEIPISKLVT